MKKTYLLVPILFGMLSSFGQKDTAIAPYKRFPTVPPFRLLKTDSSTYFTKNDLKKNEPVLIMLFNPDCEHCQHETEEIIKNIDQLKDIQIVMATMMPFGMMKTFYEKYNLQRFDNILVGQDLKYMLPPFYQIRFMPYLAMYDKKGNLITTNEGSMKIDDLISTLKSK